MSEKKAKVTIKDVAREAGVAISTASYALNKKGEITWENHKRIREIANRLGYVPDATARSLSSRRTNTVGLIIPESVGVTIRNPYYVEVISVFAEELAREGNWLSLYICNDNEGEEVKYMVTTAKVDGIVWFGYGFGQELREILRRRKIPHVCVSSDQKFEAESRLLVDSFGGSLKAIDYLYDQGHRKILCFAPYEDRYSMRLEAYYQRTTELGMGYRRVLYGNFDKNIAAEEMHKFLNSGEELPTAIFSCNDNMALGIMNSLKNAGISVPDDISIIGYDDIYEAKHTSPKLTTMSQRLDKIAKIACGYIFECRDEQTVGPGLNYVHESELIIRESVSSPRN